MRRPLAALIPSALMAAAGCMFAPSPMVPPTGDRAEPPGFEDYPPFVEIAPEAVAPDLASHPDARRHADRIRAGAARGAAFAGHVAVADWDCGPDCRQWVFIDARDGRVIWGPTTPAGARFVQHSRLFVADTPDGPRYYVWAGERLAPLGPAP